MKELDSYLNDHLAGSVAALELIAHCKRLYKARSLGVFFTEMEAQIAADQNTLRDLMSLLSIEESKVRQAGAWAGEKLGRALLAIAAISRTGWDCCLHSKDLSWASSERPSSGAR